MRSFTLRRSIHLGLTVLISAAVIFYYLISTQTLVSGSFLSGGVLLGLIGFLTLYNFRKSFSFLPLGSSALWLQFHIYVGLISFVLFLVHVRFSLPTGVLESLLAMVYLVVFGSGLIGLYITRSYPKRLTNLGEEAIFEQIPVIQHQIQSQIEQMVLQCGSEIEGSELPEFYRDHVRRFVAAGPDVLSHLIYGYSRKWRGLNRELEDQTRYLNEQEQIVLREVRDLLRRKHQLDTQHVLQGALKLWLFLHIPATYALLVLTGFHIILVNAWSGGSL